MLCAVVLPRLSPSRKRGAVSYGDVTSANVVGYQLVEIPSSPFTLFTPTLKGVSRQLDITDLEIVDEFGDPFETIGSVAFEIMDGETGGFTGQVYSHSYGLYENTHWALNDEEIEKGVTPITEGVAFSISNGMGEKLYIRVSGEVDLICKNQISDDPFSLWGNATPVGIDTLPSHSPNLMNRNAG